MICNISGSTRPSAISVKVVNGMKRLLIDVLHDEQYVASISLHGNAKNGGSSAPPSTYLSTYRLVLQYGNNFSQ